MGDREGRFMRLGWRQAAAILLVFGGSAAAAPIDAAGQRYQALVQQLKATEQDRKGGAGLIDFQAIRTAYADSLEYDPYGTLVELHRVEMLHAYEHHDLTVALQQAEKVLDHNYSDIGAHVIADLAYGDLKQSVPARYHRLLAREFLLTIMRSGDGQSPATAYQIIAVPEEYAVLNARGLGFIRQSYETIDGSHFDKITATDPARGVPVTIYFNVDRLMQWANQMFSPQFRHLPAHGGPPDAGLAAATAMLSTSGSP
jgi:hypothetical protein